MIYFVACREVNAVKIGLTFNPPFQRLMSMQAGCPLELDELRDHIALHPAPERPRRDTWRRLAAA